MQQLIDAARMIEAAIGLEVDCGDVAKIQLVPELRAEETSGSVERFHELIGGPAAERDDKRRRVAQIGADAHLRHGHLYALQLGIAQAAAAEDAHERMTQLLANAQLPLARRPTRPSRHRFTALPQARRSQGISR